MPILCTNMNKVIFIYQRVLNVVQNSGYSYFLKSGGVYNVIDYIFRKMFTGVPLRHWKQKTVCKSNHCYSLSFFDIFMLKFSFPVIFPTVGRYRDSVKNNKRSSKSKVTYFPASPCTLIKMTLFVSVCIVHEPVIFFRSI